VRAPHAIRHTGSNTLGEAPLRNADFGPHIVHASARGAV
jgi:hypothetical protein